ncbi:MAG: penicillin-binding protein 2, partial [Alphaproteobacteria bacterium]
RLASFIAAFPIQHPKYVLLVMVDEPKPRKDTYGYATGGWVAAPAVKRIVERAAPLLGLQPLPADSKEWFGPVLHDTSPIAGKAT